MASASVGSPMMSCYLSSGNWLVTMMERLRMDAAQVLDYLAKDDPQCD